MASAPYSAIGPYVSGVWLIAKNGQGAIVNQSNLPKEGNGFRYYWLGTSPSEALGSGGGNLFQAMRKLGLDVNLPNQNPGAAVNQAFAHGQAALQEPTGPAGIKSGILAELGTILSNSGPAVLAGGFGGINSAVLDSLGARVDEALSGVADETGTGSSGGSTGASGSGDSSGTSGAGKTATTAGGAGGAGGLVSKLLTSGGLADLLGLSGAEALLVRVLEALAGIALLLLGLSALTGTTNGNPVTVTKTVTRKAAKVIR